MKYLIVVLTLLFAVPAYASDVLCIGSPIEKVTSTAKATGFRLLHWEDTTCGGGVGEDGSRISKWRCFIQKWKLTDGNVAFLLYEKDTGVWRLSTGKAGDGTLMVLDPCN